MKLSSITKIAFVAMATGFMACGSDDKPTKDETKAPATEAPAAEAPGQPSYILIDKQSMTLSVIDDKGAPLYKCGVATGKAPGNKQKKGDMRTPEGIFHVQEIVDASDWKHDFGDGKGEIEGAYGAWFIRLETPGHKGIGIHGTHDPASIGTRASEGCIRLNNTDLEKVKPMVAKGMRVVIVPADADEKVNKEKSAKS